MPRKRNETDLELDLFKRLKVPKCEIFDRSDFHDFYTIKPFYVGDFWVKIYSNLVILIWGGARHHLISDAHAERAHQFLTRTLSARISS